MLRAGCVQGDLSDSSKTEGAPGASTWQRQGGHSKHFRSTAVWYEEVKTRRACQPVQRCPVLIRVSLISEQAHTRLVTKPQLPEGIGKGAAHNSSGRVHAKANGWVVFLSAVSACASPPVARVVPFRVQANLPAVSFLPYRDPGELLTQLKCPASKHGQRHHRGRRPDSRTADLLLQ